MFKGMTIGKKIGLGFGVVMLLLAAVGVLSFTGMRGIAHNADKAVAANTLSDQMVRNELAHLAWANKVSALLTDENVTKLEVQTDDHKCGFGQWLYGEDRQAAEAMVPSIAPLLKEIEAYHHDLHASAIEIGQSFQQADAMLPGQLCGREVDHLAWAAKINALFLQNLPTLDVQTDPTQCAFGHWLESEEMRERVAADPEFGRLIAAIHEPHRKLHESATAIQQNWKQCHVGLCTELKDRLDDHRQWAAQVCRAAAIEDADFEVQTDPTQCAFGKFLNSDKCRQWCADFPELKAALEACRAPHEQLHASAIKIKEAFAAGEPALAKQVYVEETVPSLDAVAEHFYAAIAAETALVQAQEQARQIFEQQTLPALAATRAGLNACQEYASNALNGMNKANQVFVANTKPNLEKVQAALGQIRTEIANHAQSANDTMLTTAAGTQRNVTVIGSVAIIIGSLLAFFIARGIVRTLTRIIAGLTDGAEQVNAAAGQVSSASQQLAEGASEQASALEETSSALEQMA
ncbi:MAG: CZB domain-containing protein, partial [Planctomycetes bacterium]|nr:CZB domain-containing protein [Planctomycetota bacterium]